MTQAAIPFIEANGARIPQIGLGTWQLQGAVLAGAVSAAAEAGYRHFDGAPRYENEADLGQALRATGLARDDYFLTTKVWYTELAPKSLIASAKASLARLGMERVDLLLIHWPNPDIPLTDTLGALCDAQDEGLARHIGVSNFPAPMLEEAVRLSRLPLVANQCEYHPRLDQNALIETCRRNGLAFVSYAPLGRGEMLKDETVTSIARAHDRSPAQILLRWHLQQGVVAIPRSGNPGRVRRNLAVTDFELTEEEMDRLSGLAVPDGRGTDPAWAPDWDAGKGGRGQAPL